MNRTSGLVKSAFLITVAMCLSIIAAGNAQAADATSAYEPLDSYMKGAMHKLGRGLTNIGTSPLELLRMTSITTNQEGFLAGSTTGLAKGLWRGALRAVVGAYETVTFFVEIPKNFEPLIKPEFVFTNMTWTPE